MRSWIGDKLHWLWFYGVLMPWATVTGCMWGRHRWFVLPITDGTTRVHCLWCRSDREPTQEELEANSSYWFTAEQHAAQQAKEEAMYQSLRELGFKVD